MKLILLLTMTAILANCHNPFLTYYRPRFFNPIFRNFNYFRYPYEQFANDPRGDFWVAQPNNPSGELVQP